MSGYAQENCVEKTKPATSGKQMQTKMLMPRARGTNAAFHVNKVPRMKKYSSLLHIRAHFLQNKLFTFVRKVLLEWPLSSNLQLHPTNIQ